MIEIKNLEDWKKEYITYNLFKNKRECRLGSSHHLKSYEYQKVGISYPEKSAELLR